MMFTAFFAQTFSGSLIVADYYTNTQSFATHCENKSKPELHCNGKCQMRKQISKEESKDQQNPERKDNKNEFLFSADFTSLIASPVTESYPEKYPLFSNGKETTMPRSLLRPPIV